MAEMHEGCDTCNLAPLTRSRSIHMLALRSVQSEFDIHSSHCGYTLCMAQSFSTCRNHSNKVKDLLPSAPWADVKSQFLQTDPTPIPCGHVFAFPCIAPHRVSPVPGASPNLGQCWSNSTYHSLCVSVVYACPSLALRPQSVESCMRKPLRGVRTACMHMQRLVLIQRHSAVGSLHDFQS